MTPVLEQQLRSATLDRDLALPGPRGCGTKVIEQAHFSDKGSVHPAKLVLGLRRVALELDLIYLRKTRLLVWSESDPPLVKTHKDDSAKICTGDQRLDD